MKKRYQESNLIVKIWRCRWYITLPFIWLYYTIIGGAPIIDDSEYIIDRLNGLMLWKLLVGTIQIKMGWYHTSDEVLDKFTNK